MNYIMANILIFLTMYLFGINHRNLCFCELLKQIYKTESKYKMSVLDSEDNWANGKHISSLAVYQWNVSDRIHPTRSQTRYRSEVMAYTTHIIRTGPGTGKLLINSCENWNEVQLCHVHTEWLTLGKWLSSLDLSSMWNRNVPALPISQDSCEQTKLHENVSVLIKE